jgi:hypothetical protein
MASRKSAGGSKGGGGGKGVSAASIQKILREAKPVADEGKGVSLPKSIPDFCKSWATTRPIVMAAIAILKFIKPKAAEALAGVVAFIDGICAG